MKSLSKLVTLAGLTAWAALPVVGQTITPISNFSQPALNDNSGNVTDDFSPAVSFTTGNEIMDLSSISIEAEIFLLGQGDLFLSLYSNSGSSPGTVLTTLTGSNPSSNSDGIYTFTDPNSTVLAANTTYWIVATDPGGSPAGGYNWALTTSTSLDSGSTWILGLMKDFNVGSWHQEDDYVPEFSVQVSGDVGSVPEPTSLVFAGLGGLSLLLLRHRK